MMLRLALATLVATVLSPLRAQVPDLYDMNTVRDVYLQFAQTNWWSQLTTNYAPEINIAATMTVDGISYPNVGVRFRGNTSYTQLPTQPNQGWEKKGFNIEMDWMVASQDLYGYDHINLNNGFHDPLFLREPVTYYVMRQHGVAPKCNWVRLWLNGTYWGVYINAQQPNKDMMKEWFRSNDGNRYRCFPTSGGFSNGRCCYTVLSPNVAASYLSAYQAKQGDGTDLMTMCTVLNAMTSGTPQSTLTSVFSVDAFYRYAAVMNVTTNTDSYLSSGKDHFLYIDEVHGDGTTFPFDLNEALRGSATLAPTQYTTTTTRPAFTRTLPLFADWTERYKWHLRSVVDQTFNPTHLVPLVQQWHAMLAADVANDTKKIYSTTLFQQNLNSTVSAPGLGGGTIAGLIPFIQQRHAFLNTNAYLTATRATPSNLTHTPALPNPTQPITFTVQAAGAAGVNLWWRRVGAFQKVAMFDDGQHGEGAAGDGTWGVAIAAQQPGALIDYYVEAVTATGASSFLPHTAELEVACPKVRIDWQLASSPVVINEVLAQNVNGAVDENGQHEDWVELHNTSNLPVDISGTWLSDSLVVLKYQFPVGTVVPANGVLRVWCDEDGTQGPLHANFKLSAGGEAVAFYAASGLSLHDSITFGQQAADVSTGRVVDGGLPWVTFPAPTYLAANLPTACGQRAYGALDPARHGVSLGLGGTLRIGTAANYTIGTGPANGVGLLGLSLLPDHLDLTPFGVTDETLLLASATLVIPGVLPLDGTGAASWPLLLPNDLGMVGVRLYAQTLTIGGTGYDSSRALELRICP
jgi:hypothetical protein